MSGNLCRETTRASAISFISVGVCNHLFLVLFKTYASVIVVAEYTATPGETDVNETLPCLPFIAVVNLGIRWWKL